jgi:hypothetical protein
VIAGTTTLTLNSLDYQGKVIQCNNTGALTITIPNSDIFPIGAEIAFIRYGAGTVTFAHQTPANLVSEGNQKSIYKQYATAALKKITASLWILSGSLE